MGPVLVAFIVIAAVAVTIAVLVADVIDNLFITFK
jgi:hypothetical protein